jgi:hypothetical protein
MSYGILYAKAYVSAFLPWNNWNNKSIHFIVIVARRPVFDSKKNEWTKVLIPTVNLNNREESQKADVTQMSVCVTAVLL